MEQIKTDHAWRYVFLKIKNTTHAALALYVPSRIIKERRIDRQIFIRGIKKLLYKKLLEKVN